MHTFTLEHQIINDSVESSLIVKMKSGLSYIVKPSQKNDYTDTRHILNVKLLNVHLNNLRLEEDNAITPLDRDIIIALKKRAEEMRGDKHELDDFRSVIAVEIFFNGPIHADADGSIHSEMLGFTLWGGIKNIGKPVKNTPTSTLKEAMNGLTAMDSGVNGMLQFCVFLNDPYRTQNPMYVNVLGKSKQVPIVSDSSKSPGLYVGLVSGETPLETISYGFEDLTDKTLEGIGIFRTRLECDKGGNTDRYLQAEELVKSTTKTLEIRSKQLDEAKTKLDKAEKDIDNLNRVIDELKSDHKRLVHSSKTEAKNSSDRSKLEEITKNYQMEQLKSRNKSGFWLDVLKGVGNLVGLAFTGLKMFLRW